MAIIMNFTAFIDSLKYMVQGMGGIFVVICIIFLSIVLLQKAYPASKDND